MSQTIPVVERRKKASSPIPSQHPTCVASPVLSDVLEVAIENLLAECYSRLASKDGTAMRRLQNMTLLEGESAAADTDTETDEEDEDELDLTAKAERPKFHC